MSCLLAEHSEKSGVYKVKQGSITKPALFCRDYPQTGVKQYQENTSWPGGYIKKKLITALSNADIHLSAHGMFRGSCLKNTSDT